MIAKSAYYSPDVLNLEVKRLFSTGWQFVALSTELQNSRDFVCLDHPGAAIVIQNFGGELRAFQNICTHRFNRLQTEERGNRPLSCGYHGWTYDKTGFPAGIPKKQQYLSGDLDADRAKLCLTAYSIEACGKFVFVNLGGEQRSLRDYLGLFWETLEEISASLGAEIAFRNIPHAANWKLLVENVLECYHCSTVHRETFIPWGVGRKPLADIILSGAHSSAHFPREPQPREKLRLMYISHMKDRPFAHDSFYHIFIFPNLFIASSEGLSFYVGQTFPRSPEHTILRMRNFEPAVELSPKHRTRQDQINLDDMKLSQRLIDEDKAILEQVQGSLKLSDRPGALGDEEVRIGEFHAHYAASMAATVSEGLAPLIPVLSRPASLLDDSAISSAASAT